MTHGPTHPSTAQHQANPTNSGILAFSGAGQQHPQPRGQGIEQCERHQRLGRREGGREEVLHLERRKGGCSSPGGKEGRTFLSCKDAGEEKERRTQHHPFHQQLLIYFTERFPLCGLGQSSAQGHHSHIPCATSPVPQPLCHIPCAPCAGGQGPRIPHFSLPGLGTSSLHLQLLWGLPAHPLGFTSFHMHQPLPKIAATTSAAILISIRCLAEQFPSSQPHGPARKSVPESSICWKSQQLLVASATLWAQQLLRCAWNEQDAERCAWNAQDPAARAVSVL